MGTLIFLSLLLVIAVLISLWILDHIIVVGGKGAPYVCTPYEVIDKVVAEVDFHPDDVFYELGCGDGRVICELAKKHLSVSFVGVELLYSAYLLAMWRVKRLGLRNVEIRHGDMYKQDLSNATHVFLWIFPNMMKKLETVFEKLHTPLTVLSMDFKFPVKQPDKCIDVNYMRRNYAQKLYIYHFL
jgi:precorrin-6B methylase 2